MKKDIMRLIRFVALGLLMARTGYDLFCVLCSFVLAVASFYDGMQVKKGENDNV